MHYISLFLPVSEPHILLFRRSLNMNQNNNAQKCWPLAVEFSTLKEQIEQFCVSVTGWLWIRMNYIFFFSGWDILDKNKSLDCVSPNHFRVNFSFETCTYFYVGFIFCIKVSSVQLSCATVELLYSLVICINIVYH